MNENSKELSDFVKQEIDKLKPYENQKLKFPLGDHSFNFWEFDAESVFPHSPELQKSFNKIKKKKLRKKGIIFNILKSRWK